MYFVTRGIAIISGSVDRLYAPSSTLKLATAEHLTNLLEPYSDVGFRAWSQSKPIFFNHGRLVRVVKKNFKSSYILWYKVGKQLDI